MSASGSPALPPGFWEAALDAVDVSLEVRESGGRRVFANAAAPPEAEASPGARREEVQLAGRTYLVERGEFRFAEQSYRLAVSVDVDAQRRLQDELFTRAYFDPLTSLPNRELCKRALDDLAGDPHQGFSLIVIAVEKFAQIATIYGAAAADELLIRLSERMSQTLVSPEWLARVGQEEFCLIVPGLVDRDELRSRASRLLERIAAPGLVDGLEVFAAARAGAAIWPSDDATPDGVWRKARSALAAAQRADRAGARLFEPEIERQELERARLELSLRSAIRDRRIGCAYQPKVDFRTGKVDGVEVLMRWRDDAGEWNTPGDFLDLAHRVGLTNDITRLVFEDTVASLDILDQTFTPGLSVGFNISARQAGDSRFMKRFAEDLAATGCAHRFVLELTEEAFLPATQFQMRILPMLRELGARIAIDDFGSGYSSLSTLADITADEVKVDRSLIVGIDAKPRNQSMLRAIESIGVTLGAEVMVEGVETEAELAYLRDHSAIRVAQGFLLGRPMVLPSPSSSHSVVSSRSEVGRDRIATRAVERRLR